MLNNIKCVAVGDGAVGKTSLLLTYSTNQFPQEYVPTVFDNYSVNIMINEKVFSLGLWDTAGQEDYDRIRPLSYPNTDVFLLCFSLGNYVSLLNIPSKWYPELHSFDPDVPIVLVGLKKDIRDNHANQQNRLGFVRLNRRTVSTDEAEAIAKQIGAYSYTEVSAYTGENIQKVFRDVIISVLKNRKEINCKNTNRHKKRCIIL